MRGFQEFLTDQSDRMEKMTKSVKKVENACSDHSESAKNELYASFDSQKTKYRVCKHLHPLSKISELEMSGFVLKFTEIS